MGLWLLMWATAMGLLIQLLSACLGVATGKHLAELCRDCSTLVLTMTVEGEARALCVKGRSGSLHVGIVVASGSCVEGSSSGLFVEGSYLLHSSGSFVERRSHWQLMVIIPKQGKIIWFCLLHRKMKNDLRSMLQGVMGKSRGQLVQVLYPKVCNKQLDSWECGFYVMSWIKSIISAAITDDWNEIK
ncbi:hypothetical protein LR48_Vigan07g255700 [Vigna angularis]|uniref:Ubiquitin-like protease family profile domain-containing protein n=1 Tax=Phaseolus angularis TaxID=3914 RepID=A0A0L9V1E0_PHAAN|nr:hypothetical protein LR48_Vigan07g255700 [Vigna angularis]